MSDELIDQAVEIEEIEEMTANARRAFAEVVRLDQPGVGSPALVKGAMQNCIAASSALAAALSVALDKARGANENGRRAAVAPSLPAEDVQKVIVKVGASHRLPYPDNCDTVRAADQWSRGQTIGDRDRRLIGLGDAKEATSDGASV